MSNAGSGPSGLTVVEDAGLRFVEGPADQMLMRTVEEATLVLEACFAAGVDSAVLYAPNLTPCFFDLRSGEAGAVLQKLRTYRVRLAVVCPASHVQFSSRFREMADEEKRGDYFGVFESVEAAREWLKTSDYGDG